MNLVWNGKCSQDRAGNPWRNLRQGFPFNNQQISAYSIFLI